MCIYWCVFYNDTFASITFICEQRSWTIQTSIKRVFSLKPLNMSLNPWGNTCILLLNMRTTTTLAAATSTKKNWTWNGIKPASSWIFGRSEKEEKKKHFYFPFSLMLCAMWQICTNAVIYEKVAYRFIHWKHRCKA